MINLKLLREQKNLTQSQLGEILGIARNSISRYENGEREPDNETILKLADFFQVTTDFLLGKTDKKTSSSLSKDDEAILKEIKYAFSGDYNKELTVEEKKELVNLAKIARSIKEGKQK